MNPTAALIIGLAIGIALGALIGALSARSRSHTAAAAVSTLAAELEAERSRVLAETARSGLLNQQLDALKAEQSSDTRLDEALKAVQQNMVNLVNQSREAELARTKAEATLREQMESMKVGNESLLLETTKLAGALSNSQTRGKYGETQLERLLEDSGLIEGVHFFKQDYSVREDRISKPDIKIAIPGGSEIYIDSKFPFDRFLDGVGEKDPIRRAEFMQQHAKDLLGHVNALAKRGYSEGANSADYVVLFAPFESILSEALEVEPGLLHKAFEKGVTIATPTTMMALLRTVAHVFSQSDMAHNAAAIKELAGELLKRIGRVHQRIAKLGSTIKSSESAFNELIASAESNMLVPARKMAALGVPTTSKLKALEPIDEDLRTIKSAIGGPVGAISPLNDLDELDEEQDLDYIETKDLGENSDHEL